MGKDENGAVPSKRHHHRKSASESEPNPDSDTDEESIKSESHKRKAKSKKSTSTSSRSTKTSGSKRRRSRDRDSYSSSSEYDDSDSDSYSSDSDSSRRRKDRKRREEEKKERRRREKDKEKRRKRKEKEKKRKDKKEKGKKGAVTNSWGKYGIIKETDMWNKRPEFTAWLLEVKKVNLESLPTWEEKQMFKDFMEDHNTATFPSKKYYNLDAYHQHKIEKEIRKGSTRVRESEMTIFNDEEQKRLEQQRERERQKEAEVEALKRSMQGGMAQAMKEQARLKEEMAYQYKLGNFEAAAAIQRRLDPDITM